jgi:hypothetical protein
VNTVVIVDTVTEVESDVDASIGLVTVMDVLIEVDTSVSVISVVVEV